MDFKRRMAGPLALFTLGPVLFQVACPVYASAQTSASAAAGDKAQVWKKEQIDPQFTNLIDEAKSTGLAETVLGNYGNHAVRLLVRTADGQAEVHGRSSDVIIVTKGKAMLITGGAVIDPKTGENGEIRGSGIKGGIRRVISAGDVVHISPGTPHRMLVQRGTSFQAVLIKVQE